MAVPGRSGAYVAQIDDIGDAISFDLDDTKWTNNPTSFEVNTLPPGFTFDGDQTLEGTQTTKMVYTLFIRASNADGSSAWVPLLWTVNVTIEVTFRTLYGLSLAWTELHPIAGGDAVVDILRGTLRGRQTPGGSGLLLTNDIGNDGTAARYDSSRVDTQLLLDGVAASFFRATEPGWEIVIDTLG